MKRWMILLIGFLLIGCTKDIPETPDSAATSAPTTDPQLPTPEPVVELPTDPIPIDASLYSPDNCRYMLLETEEVRIELIFSKELSYYHNLVLMHAENRTAQQINVTVSDIILNGNVQTNCETYFDLSAKTAEKRSLSSSLEVPCAMIGFENLRELSASVRIQYANGSTSDPLPCKAAFPEGILLHYGYRDCCDMRADRQILFADEDITVALLGCGSFYQDSSFENLTGILWAENRTDRTIPVKVSSISLNGIAISPYSSVRYLDPGNACIISFSVYQSDLDLIGVQSIESMRLQILTSEEENSAVIGAEGGAWHSVALAMSGQSSIVSDDGEIVYDDGLLALGLNRIDIRYDAYGYSGVMYTEIRYIVSVENRRAEGVRLKPTETMVDDELYRDPYTKTTYVSLENNAFGPHSKGFMILTVRLPSDSVSDTIPSLSFLLQVQSQGGDTIFYTINDRIKLTKE